MNSGRNDLMITKIYADFNGIERCEIDPTWAYLNLTGYGTLACLNFHRIKLEEGQEFLFCEPNDIAVLGVTYFDEKRIASNCSGWFAKCKWAEIFECPPFDFDFGTHLCFSCRRNIESYLDQVGRNYDENCPHCSTAVMFPMSAP